LFDYHAVREARVTVTFASANLRAHAAAPALIQHADRDLTWQVREVLESWRHPGYPARVAGEPDAGRCYRLAAEGPLAGRPGERGECTVIIRSYAGRPGWWMSPA
jgi:hypothetical protein